MNEQTIKDIDRAFKALEERDELLDKIKEERNELLNKIKAEIVELDNKLCQQSLSDNKFCPQVFLSEDIDRKIHRAYRECISIINKYKE